MKIVEGKVVVLGFQGVGKTSMITRYSNKTFENHGIPTIGASFCTFKVNVENSTITLQVWDTAGQERFRSMAPMYYRNASAAMLVFDLTQYNTFSAIQSWVTELRRNVERSMVLVVIGNKSDLKAERQVDAEESRVYAATIGASYYETSALQDEGLESVFTSIAMGLLKQSTSDRNSTAVKVDESAHSDFDDRSVALIPSLEESPKNFSIAHGIHEKPYMCC